jgi:hypothetical protein
MLTSFTSTAFFIHLLIVHPIVTYMKNIKIFSSYYKRNDSHYPSINTSNINVSYFIPKTYLSRLYHNLDPILCFLK